MKTEIALREDGRLRRADGGKMAHYMLRWRMRDGSTGAWGETVSATITD